MEIFEKERSHREAENIKNIKEAESLSEKVKGLSIVILRSASETGQLYGSVSNRDIARLVTDNGFNISYNQVILNKTIKELGVYFVGITLHPEVIIEIKLNVSPSTVVENLVPLGIVKEDLKGDSEELETSTTNVILALGDKELLGTYPNCLALATALPLICAESRNASFNAKWAAIAL